MSALGSRVSDASALPQTADITQRGEVAVKALEKEILPSAQEIEVDVEPVDIGDELRQRVQSRLDLWPVVILRPIVREFLHRRDYDATSKGYSVGNYDLLNVLEAQRTLYATRLEIVNARANFKRRRCKLRL